jgi:putative N6-adenine-specific DNA methylase
MTPITLIITVAFGLESVLKDELKALGFKNLKASDGRVECAAVFDDIARLNLNLRVADRVLLKLAEYKAVDFDQFFDPVAELPWERWIPAESKMTVVGYSAKSKLASVRTCQSMIKKAVLTRLAQALKVSSFPETGHEFIIHFSVYKDVVVLSLDSTGFALNRRGYREHSGPTPIKETLAVGLLHFSGWQPGEVLIDPMCGSGTFLIEAALKARQKAPGLLREFACEHWPFLSPDIWPRARQEAHAATLPSQQPLLFGYDSEPARVKDAKINARRAGVNDDIVFECRPVSELVLDSDTGTLITNPPYGIKMEVHELAGIYADLNRMMTGKSGWRMLVVTADTGFPKHMTFARPAKIRKLYNGTLPVGVYYYESSKGGKG